MASVGLQPYTWPAAPAPSQARLRSHHPTQRGLLRLWLTAASDADANNLRNQIVELVTDGQDQITYTVGAASPWTAFSSPGISGAYGLNTSNMGSSSHGKSALTAQLIANSTPVSVAGWFNLSSSNIGSSGPSFGCIMGKINGDNTQGWGLVTQSSVGTFLVGSAPGGTANNQSSFAKPSWWSSGTWYHYCLTWDGVFTNNNNWNLYVNGQPCSVSSHQAGSGSHSSDSTFAFGVMCSAGGSTTNVTGSWAGPVCVWNRILDQQEALALTLDPFLLLEPPVSRTWFLPGASTAYSLSAGTGTFNLAGQAATLAAGMPGAAGSFSLTGQAAGFGLAMPGAAGSFVLTGQVATFAVAMPGSVGTFVLTGQATTLVPAVVAGAGAFVLAGEDATFNFHATMTGGTGAFVLTGDVANLGPGLVAGPGAFVLTGFPSILVKLMCLSGSAVIGTKFVGRVAHNTRMMGTVVYNARLKGSLAFETRLTGAVAHETRLSGTVSVCPS